LRGKGREGGSEVFLQEWAIWWEGEIKKNVTLESCLLLQSLNHTYLVAVENEVELADILKALVQGLHEDCVVRERI